MRCAWRWAVCCGLYGARYIQNETHETVQSGIYNARNVWKRSFEDVATSSWQRCSPHLRISRMTWRRTRAWPHRSDTVLDSATSPPLPAFGSIRTTPQNFLCIPSIHCLNGMSE